MSNALHTRRILAEFDAADDLQLTKGANWYWHALLVAEDVAERHTVATETAVAVIAALSPAHSWIRNVTAAHELLLTGDVTGYLIGANITKARRIVAGEAPLAVLGGLKVRSFYHNILSGGADDGHVTVDRHAAATAYGLPTFARSLTPKQYVDIADSYRSAARRRGVTPAVMQATVWVPRAQ